MRIPSKYSEQGQIMQDFCPSQGKDWKAWRYDKESYPANQKKKITKQMER